MERPPWRAPPHSPEAPCLVEAPFEAQAGNRRNKRAAAQAAAAKAAAEPEYHTLLRRQAETLAARTAVRRALAVSRIEETRLTQQLAEQSAVRAFAEAEAEAANRDLLDLVAELGGDEFVLSCAEVVMAVAVQRGEA